MAKERPLSIAVILGVKGKGLQEAIKDTKRLGSQLTGLADTAAKAAVGFAAFKGGQLLANFARDAIDAGRDLQVNMNGLQSVFGSATGEMVEFSKGMSSMGMSMAQTAKASTFIGSVLKQSGFAMGEVTKQTKFLIKAAADLSLTFGYDVQESLLAITALFRGEYDPIEKFGVAMKQSEIEGVKLERGLSKLTGSAERFADATIRLELFTERAGDSLGAYERQANTLRVAQDVLRASFQNMQQILGAAMLPAVRDLTLALQPLVTAIGPILATAIQNLIPLINSFSENSAQITRVFIDFIKAIAMAAAVMGRIAEHIVNNIGLYITLAKVVATVAIGLYALRIGVAVMNAIRDATMATNITLGLTDLALKRIKYSIIALPVVGWIAGIVMLATDLFGLTATAEDAGKSIEEMFDMNELLQAQEGIESVSLATDGLNDSLGDTAGAAGGATDAVVGFYKKLSDEIVKQQAKLRLQQMGASEGLIQAILGSGEDWQRVFSDVVSRGMAGVADVQRMFRATAAGFDEAMAQWEKEYGEPFRKFKEDALAARDALVEFTKEIDILPSVAETLGEFERSAVDNLASIEEKLDEAFNNKQLLRNSYENLQQYARDEFNVLRQIERQRDDIIGRRDAAEALINSVQSSIKGTGRLVSLFGDVEKQVAGIDVVEFATRTVSAGRQLKEFRTALVTNFVEPIEKAASKADKLVSSYRAVVERTREFVENLKTLRSLGLDPMLFNQLVEAGVEAGGATAQALVEGGSETINELNGLFKELDTLGAELGETTAQVMFGQGQNFVNGIVAGLEDQAGELEISAQSIAEAFTMTFEQVLVNGINSAIDAAEAAMKRMPRIEDFMGDMNFGGLGGDGDAGGRNVAGPGVKIGGLVSSQLSELAAEKRGIGPQYGFDTPQRLTPKDFQPVSPAGGRSFSTTTNYNVFSRATTSRTFANELKTVTNKNGTLDTSRPGKRFFGVD
jgi:uncharacterized Tic20 family protein